MAKMFLVYIKVGVCYEGYYLGAPMRATSNKNEARLYYTYKDAVEEIKRHGWKHTTVPETGFTTAHVLRM